jgi:hypothetical protein
MIIKKGTSMLTDVAIAGDINVCKIEAENVLKYNDLTMQIQHLWNVKIKVKPVIIGATGTISQSLRQYLRNIPGKQEIKELPKKQPYWALHTYYGK